MFTEYEWAKYIVDKLRENGHEAFLVGGCVRDMIMNITPSDYDVVTSASFDEIKTVFSRTVNVGSSFGVMLLVKDKKVCQVSTFRENAKTPFEDAQKRDFTINGLYYDHVTGQIFDWVNGTSDIRRKIVRAVGCPKSRFNDDPIRLIRAVRFASTLRFNIDEKTYRTIKEMAGSITLSSTERIRDEIIKIFNNKNSGKGFSILIECGLFKEIFPDIFKIYQTNPDLIELTKQMLNFIEEPNYFLGLSALLCVMGFVDYNTSNMDKKIKLIKKILNYYKFSNNDIKSITAILKNHIVFIKTGSLSDGVKKKLMQSSTFLFELEIHKVHLKTLKKDLDSYNDLKSLYHTLTKKEIFPDPLLTGKDLIARGITPNRSWGNLFGELELMQLEGTINTKEDAFLWIKKRLK